MGSDSGDAGTGTASTDEKYALVAVIVALVCVVLGALYLRNKSSKSNNELDDLLGGGAGDSSRSSSSSSKSANEIVNLDTHPESDYYKKLRSQVLFKDGKPANDIDVIKLRKHLMRRAIQCFPSILEVQLKMPEVEKGFKAAMISEERYKKMKALEQFVKQEVDDIREDAEMLQKGWGEFILTEAHKSYMMFVQKTESSAKAAKAKQDDSLSPAGPTNSTNSTAARGGSGSRSNSSSSSNNINKNNSSSSGADNDNDSPPPLTSNPADDIDDDDRPDDIIIGGNRK